MEILEQIGKVIVQRRKSLNISQDELAKTTGISRHYLSDIENGIRAVSVPVIKSLANRLNWTLTDLFSIIERPGEGIELKNEGKDKSFVFRFGQTVQRLRFDERLSVDLFARIIGVSIEDLEEIEAGTNQVSLEMLEKIAIALRKTTSELLLEVERMDS